MDNMRILKGYSKEERKELEEAKDNNFFSVIALICSIHRGDDDNCRALYEKYYCENTNKNNQMAKDIIDFYTGNAKFPEEKWYVHFINGNDESYLNRGVESKNIYPDSKKQTNNFQTQFTKQEVENINPDYLLFLEKVPDEELED